MDRRAVLGVPLAVNGDLAGVGAVQADDHAHRGGLPGPVRPEKTRHHTGFDGEAEVVDGDLLTIFLADVIDDDQGTLLTLTLPASLPGAPASSSGRRHFRVP